MGTTEYQITATAVIAALSQFQWPLRVSAVKMTVATAQTIHCAVLLFMSTFRFDSSDRLSNSITAYINRQLATDY